MRNGGQTDLERTIKRAEDPQITIKDCHRNVLTICNNM